MMLHRHLIAAVAAIAPTISIADPTDGYYHHMDGWGLGIMGFGMMILFWGGLAAVIILAFNWFGNGEGRLNGPTGRRQDPLEVLKERLARGEIDIEDYEARRKALGGKA